MTTTSTRTLRFALAALLAIAVCSASIVGVHSIAPGAGGPDSAIIIADQPLSHSATVGSARTGLELALVVVVALVLWSARDGLVLTVAPVNETNTKG